MAPYAAPLNESINIKKASPFYPGSSRLLLGFARDTSHIYPALGQQAEYHLGLIVA